MESSLNIRVVLQLLNNFHLCLFKIFESYYTAMILTFDRQFEFESDFETVILNYDAIKLSYLFSSFFMFFYDFVTIVGSRIYSIDAILTDF